ncbi:hypothetical protein UAJ10_13225 [Nitrospirillum sp. BR 11164]|uniref:hypothetical protein n=1 Tax=Nitrospirillum sp. BR 11164 TaxID=3104324 RepID=UPI002AFF010D|nr:hypothetical protein [Nitrospirillum sp. BR 11164]MEA1649966.1 hypothetical protein [Nitrospirillum sp. BR 11164]
MFCLLLPEAMDMAAEATRLIPWLLRRRLARLRFLLRGPAVASGDLRGTLAKGELPGTADYFRDMIIQDPCTYAEFLARLT